MVHDISKTMTKQDILGRLESLPFIDIFEVTGQQVVAYDQRSATDFTIRFAEYFSREEFQKLIHVSPEIPACLRFDTDALTDYLWKVIDRNAFLTLSGLWFVYADGEYGTIAQFHDCDEAITLPDHNAKGCMWFARQVCIVDVGRIIAKHPQASLDFLRREIIVTALHELRHLMLDTNPVLPVGEYPLELGTEFLVERYAQEICEDAQISHIFIGKDKRL